LGLDIKLGNFLVPQNYIECIAMKTPKEQTVMLEKISGSDAYKADYDRYIYIVTNVINLVIEFPVFTEL